MYDHRSKDRLASLIQSQCIEHGEFTLSSGAKSNIYIDIRKGSLFGPVLYEIVEQLKFALEEFTFDSIGGPCIGADPIIGAYLYMYGDRGFLIRKKEKDHGKKGRVIGSVLPNDVCVLVEDVVTTGNSVLEAARVMEDFGCRISGIVAIVDRLAGAKELFENHSIPYKSILTMDDLKD